MATEENLTGDIKAQKAELAKILEENDRLRYRIGILERTLEEAEQEQQRQLAEQ